jgi:hypothetical protein
MEGVALGAGGKMSHFREVCLDHGVLIRQCRCQSPGKVLVRKTCPGPGICPAFTAVGDFTGDFPTGPTGPTGPAAGHYVQYAGTTHYVEHIKPEPEIDHPEIREGVFDEQPMPKIGGEGSSAQDLAIEGIEERKAIGLERYGTLLYPFNGRDMFRDLLEECQDAIVYASAYQEERKSATQVLQRVVEELREAERVADSDEPDNAIARGDMADHVREALIGAERIAAWLRGEDQ